MVLVLGLVCILINFVTRVPYNAFWQRKVYGLVPRPVRATRVTRGGLEPREIFSRQAGKVTSHPKSPRTTGNEAGLRQGRK